MKRLIIPAAFAMLALTDPVLAHASLKSSVPAADVAIASPEALELGFSEVLNPTFSGIKLVGPDGAVIETGKPATVGDGTQMYVPLSAPLAPGGYIVEWDVLSVDGHKLDGSYGFTIIP